VTLNGADTSTDGAVASVDPVTETLPVAPGNVHSGVPPVAGAAVGHVLAAAAVTGAEGGSRSAIADALVDELVADVSVSELQAASVMTNDAAQVTIATEEGTRIEFTVVTVQTSDARPLRGLTSGHPGNPDRNDTYRFAE
jgi:hypothetical protein